MGYSVEMMGLFQWMKEQGLFADIRRVVDFGSQELHFAPQDTMSHRYRNVIATTVKSFTGQTLSDDALERLSNRASAREFFEILNIDYKALDADGWYDKPFDFNLDSARDEDRGGYCLCINAGTTEHLIDQCNAFNIAHDLVRPGGMMVHALPFLGSVDHGFFNYNPNFFTALARFNSYELLGLWLNPANSASLIPWSEGLLDHFSASSDPSKSVSIWCALKKQHDLDFCVPFQSGYEAAQAATNLARYNYVIDGKRLSGVEAMKSQSPQESLSSASGKRLFAEILRRVKRRAGIGG